MSRSINSKKDAIIKNIDELFGDTSVPPESTLQLLEDIQSEVGFKIEAIREDLKRKEKQDADRH